jgi:uncharacterized protein YfaS (alpha-2-macroglobulin family)
MQLKFFRIWHLLAGAAIIVGILSLWSFRSKNGLGNGDEWLEKLIEINSIFQEKYSSERAYLHLDKPFYVPSETIWFQAYVQNEAILKPSKQSDILYVEFIDPKGNVDKKIQLILEEGTAAGEFDLPEDAAVGVYKIKVYTKWQENFLLQENANPLIFEKEITVQKVVLPRLKMKLDFQKDAYGAGDKVNAGLDLQSFTNEALTDKEVEFRESKRSSYFKIKSQNK